jgi:hypothetical protein
MANTPMGTDAFTPFWSVEEINSQLEAASVVLDIQDDGVFSARVTFDLAEGA